MIRWAVGCVRRACGALMMLFLLVCGAEVAVRLLELRNHRPANARRAASPLELLTVPSWTTRQELRPLISLRVRSAGAASAHEIRTNQFGLRGSEMEIPKPVDVYRVLCLGDERLLGAQYPEQDVLTSRLQAELQQRTKLRVEVWNAGVPGACPLTESLLMTHRLGAVQADLVISVVEEQHLVRDAAYRRLTRIDANGQPLACRHPALGKKSTRGELATWRDSFRLVDLGLRWAGDTWRNKTAAEFAYDSDGSLPSLDQSRQNPQVIERTLQPYVSWSRWCRQSSAALCVCEIQPSSATKSPFSTHLASLATDHSFSHWAIPQAADRRAASAAGRWTSAEHAQFAAHLAEQIVRDLPGPWKSEYFQPEDQAVSPVSHEAQSPPRQIMQFPTVQPR